jgi:aspartyl-tRNA synthetase
MLKYGTDKPDLRFKAEIADLSDIFANSNFNAFKGGIEQGKVVRGIAVPGVADKSRKFLKELEEFAKEAGAKGLASLIYTDEAIKGSLAKPLSDECKAALKERMQAENGHGIFMVAAG